MDAIKRERDAKLASFKSFFIIVHFNVRTAKIIERFIIRKKINEW